jgi:hypothetical protein
VAQGSEFQVNTSTTSLNEYPDVAMDSAGDLAITWQGSNAGSGWNVYAQRYNSSGVAQGSEFQVNGSTTAAQSPTIAMDSSGNFVISYQNVSSGSVSAQQYNASGVAQGCAFQVCTSTSGSGIGASIAITSTGEAVFSWGTSGTGSSNGIFGAQFVVI